MAQQLHSRESATLPTAKPLRASLKPKRSAEAKGLTTQSDKNKRKKVETRTHSKKTGRNPKSLISRKQIKIKNENNNSIYIWHYHHSIDGL